MNHSWFKVKPHSKLVHVDAHVITSSAWFKVYNYIHGHMIMMTALYTGTQMVRQKIAK